MMENLKILPFLPLHIPLVKNFIDCWSGDNFLTESELAEIYELSCLRNEEGGLNASMLAFCEDELVGVRLSYAPGKFLKKMRGVSPSLWQVEASKVAYFKSLFVAQNFRHQGVGKILSQQSMKTLKKMGAQAILCHSWLESPENSSQLYLQKMGFHPVQIHSRFWYEVDYLCVRCAPSRCECTSMEMIKYLRGQA